MTRKSKYLTTLGLVGLFAASFAVAVSASDDSCSLCYYSCAIERAQCLASGAPAGQCYFQYDGCITNECSNCIPN